MIASQKPGIAMPAVTKAVTTWSIQEPRFIAATTPAGIATSSARVSETSASSSDAGSRSAIIDVTLTRLMYDWPRSPLTRLVSQDRYWR